MNSSKKHKFKTDDRVQYISFNAASDPGTVTSVNDKYVFVMFDKYTARHCTSQACRPDDLRRK